MHKMNASHTAELGRIPILIDACVLYTIDAASSDTLLMDTISYNRCTALLNISRSSAVTLIKKSKF